jgi:hypothetical protein
MGTDPIYCPKSGNRNYEVRLHNQAVRSLLKENRHHDRFADAWADPRRQVVEARSADEAHRIASDLYPPEQGFVIDAVLPVR